MKKNNELVGIEILRFICAFGVIVWHYQHFFFRGGWNSDVGAALRPTLPLYSIMFVFYDNGSLAVPFFWTISGFIFYLHYAQSVRGGAVGFPDYVVRRFSRLYPLHFVTLLLVAAGQYAYYKSHGETFIYSWNKPIWFASHLFMASNWFAREPLTFNGPVWSVSIEILIYLVFFPVVRAFGSNALVAALVAGAFAIGFNLWHGVMSPKVFACGMYFFAGGVAQRLYTRPVSLQMAGIVALAILATWIYVRQGENTASLLFLAMSTVLITAKLGETIFRLPFAHVAFLGNATYSSYLLHFPVQLLLVLLADAMGWKREIFYSPMAFIAFLGCVVGLSLVAHRYFEMPAQSRLRAFANSASFAIASNYAGRLIKPKQPGTPRA